MWILLPLLAASENSQCKCATAAEYDWSGAATTGLCDDGELESSAMFEGAPTCLAADATGAPASYGLGECKAWDETALSVCNASKYEGNNVPPSWSRRAAVDGRAELLASERAALLAAFQKVEQTAPLRHGAAAWAWDFWTLRVTAARSGKIGQTPANFGQNLAKI